MDIVETLITGVYTLLLILDGIVYNLVNYFYEIFLFLAKINIFSNNDYEEIVQSIYIVLGVIMLFILVIRDLIVPERKRKEKKEKKLKKKEEAMKAKVKKMEKKLDTKIEEVVKEEKEKENK